MIVELRVLLPVLLIPPKVVINLTLSGMGLKLIVGCILIAVPTISMVTEVGLISPLQIEIDVRLLHLATYLICLIHGLN